MSAYENVVIGKLRLKGGKLMTVRESSCKKKKKHKGQHAPSHDFSGGDNMIATDLNHTNMQNEGTKDDGERLTPAERRYLERWQEIDLQRMAKAAKKSHRDRIHEFNQYLASLSEHYDIPKVGPG